jgi:hypothetical protein
VQIPIQRVAPAGYAALADFCRHADEAEPRDVACRGP